MTDNGNNGDAMVIKNHHREQLEQRNNYKEALEKILNASTVGEMVRIAERVLKENKE
jgi:hypothetical protein